MIPALGYNGQKVIVLGMGRSGLSAAAALQAGGADVYCWDDGETGRARAVDAGFACADPLRGGLEGAAALITSPGIAHLYPKPHPAIAQAYAMGVPVDNDIGLFFASIARTSWDRFETIPRVVAVTGSNGKSTTSALIHHLLTHAGIKTQLAGNIGRGVLDLDPLTDGEVVVLELSSYQTELARALTPDIAVFTNLSPDHLDRHAGFGGYFAAKRRLFAEGGPDRAIIGVDEIEGQMLANQLSVGAADDRVIRVSSGQKLVGSGWSVTARKGFLAETRKTRQQGSIDLRGRMHLPGTHNHQNACAAYAVLRALNVAPRVIEAGMHSFMGLPHRSQMVRDVNGVAYVNDSKATNVDSAVKALGAFKRIHWICGGLQKEGGLDALSGATGDVICAYVIGREAEDFARQLDCKTQVCGTMETAVSQAANAAQSGDVVLLAPAAASFDQYDSFEARGADFIARVNDL
ncbi:MAG: UDP-N-acetylmuramoyl-L-alanine--D-glutamate ligase [Planktomarina sp.]